MKAKIERPSFWQQVKHARGSRQKQTEGGREHKELMKERGRRKRNKEIKKKYIEEEMMTADLCFQVMLTANKNLNGDRNNKAKTKVGGSGGGGVNQCSRSALG